MTTTDLTDHRAGHGSSGAQSSCAGSVTSTAAARHAMAPSDVLPLPPGHPNGQQEGDAQSPDAVGVTTSANPATPATTPKTCLPGLADPILALLADTLDDLEGMRKATDNRLRQLTRNEPDSDGETRGFGLPETDPAVARLAGIAEAIATLEAEAERNLTKRLRQHPLHNWQQTHRGVGEKQFARLLAALGDPFWHAQQDRPRLVSELWQYAGHGDPERSRRRKGQQVEHSPTAKMRVYLIAVRCMMSGGPYRDVYDQRRTKTADRMHDKPCVRCGPSGKPAQPGTPWSKAHQLADALRIVGKEILRDLWREAKRIHEQDGNPAMSEWISIPPTPGLPSTTGVA